MKRTIVAVVSLLAMFLFVLGCGGENPAMSAGEDPAMAPAAKKGGNGGKPEQAGAAAADNCTTIQSGTLLTSDGATISTGFDDWGYNYQGLMFNGGYCDAYRDALWCQPYKDDSLGMKWNDAWLSNKDCDGDGLLDRHYGDDSYIGSGAWLTNHQSGGKGKDHWTYFVKIVAAPADAKLVDANWVGADGTEIGPVIWGSFAIIQEVASGEGATYVSPSGPGLGKF